MRYTFKTTISLFLLLAAVFMPVNTTLNSTELFRSSWVPLESAMRYDQACFLTAHNAFASVEDGWQLYMMQNLSIPAQLKQGVRGFMLDVYNYEGQLKLCHGGCRFIHSFQQSVATGLSALVWPNDSYQLLSTALEKIIEWLERNPLEIVTVFIENHAGKSVVNDALRVVNGLEKIAFQPHEWNFAESDGLWPTLGWMRKHNKRLVIFHEDKNKHKKTIEPETGDFKAQSEYTTQLTEQPSEDSFIFWEVWDHVIESQYGTLDKTRVCVEREHSLAESHKERKLYLFNYFGKIASSPAQSRINNSYDTLKEVIEFCQRKRLAQRKLPNFIALDFVDQGEGLELVNYYNREMKKDLGILQLYNPRATTSINELERVKL